MAKQIKTIKIGQRTFIRSSISIDKFTGSGSMVVFSSDRNITPLLGSVFFYAKKPYTVVEYNAWSKPAVDMLGFIVEFKKS